ncbi:hypothetical protein M758_1G173300 [Ceratodon purpureus]|nr:hypothetical protein M758_1G173200 [Ceratodon purpureus]KAG0630366.1 hypothetical protein M758_1G173300 [Ceratodon purpureus]
MSHPRLLAMPRPGLPAMLLLGLHRARPCLLRWWRRLLMLLPQAQVLPKAHRGHMLPRPCQACNFAQLMVSKFLLQLEVGCQEEEPVPQIWMQLVEISLAHYRPRRGHFENYWRKNDRFRLGRQSGVDRKL